MSSHNITWAFKPNKRWKITAELRTKSPLHIGNGDLIEHPSSSKDEEFNNVNACIKDFAGKPYLPGTTLKGNLFTWLNERICEDQLRQDLYLLFGQASAKNEQGTGGIAEFHNARLVTEITDGKNYPYWNQKTQTYIETSAAINRITRTVADRKLFHTELVPPNVGFKVIITGTMSNEQAALLIFALQAFSNPDQAATLGSENTSGNGRMFLIDRVKVANMDAQQVSDWLKTRDTFDMAEEALINLNNDAIERLVEPIKKSLTVNARNDLIKLVIQMDGPFLINNPEFKDQDGTETDHQPLLDGNKKPLLSGKSLRGALRSQAERILRSLGYHCCNTVDPCDPIFDKQDIENLCPACQVFGAGGWQSPLHIHPFNYEGEARPTVDQEFVAIDRFHGGGKQGAKYNATFYFRPKFTGFIALDNRLPTWGKGLLALMLRDLREGDIKLGIAVNKGYGGIEHVTVTPEPFTENDLRVFRDKYPEQTPVKIAQNGEDQQQAARQVTPVKDEQFKANPFYNPYQFIPVKTPGDQSRWLEKNALNSGKHHHSHAIYRNQTDSGQSLYHGRLHCKLVAETPFFIGAQRDEQQLPAKVENFLLNGELAIPATSLRGLLSSITEGASNSALRVLDNGLLSYRKTMQSLEPKDRPLSAIGMIIGEGNDLKLIPLALPTLDLHNGYYQQPSVFNRMFPDNRAKLKVYLNDAYRNEMAAFLTDKETWTTDNKQIFYLDLDRLHLKMTNGRLDFNGYEELLRHPSSRNGNNFIIGQKIVSTNAYPIPATNVSVEEKNRLTPGILRILGNTHRGNDMPRTKKHELFIPVPDEFANDFDKFIMDAEAFVISQDAIKRFEELADQRTDSQKAKTLQYDEQRLPYHLKGAVRTVDYKLRLKQGDLVYFRPDDNDHRIVAEVAFSAHWRGRVEDRRQQPAKVFEFFPKDLLPFNSKRGSLSPAELLFGFVEEQGPKKDKKNQEQPTPENSLAFAGKVRISTGQLINPAKKSTKQLLEPEITLKILASPKLPSPSMYFRNRTPLQNPIPKHELCPESHQARGRKQYLHAMRQKDNPTQVQKLTPTGNVAGAGNSLNPWQSGINDPDTLKQKVRIEPIKANTTFEFYVDFDNLTDWELGLLCYALKPSESYRHKLGMGKPIGLGSVNIRIEKLELIDRQKRYGKDHLFNSDRYNVNPQHAPSVDVLRDCFIHTMDDDIRHAFELLGDPNNINSPVHYPQVRDQNIENETYRWYVANDIGSGQGQRKIPAKNKFLPLINSNTEQLPTLDRHDWAD